MIQKSSGDFGGDTLRMRQANSYKRKRCAFAVGKAALYSYDKLY